MYLYECKISKSKSDVNFGRMTNSGKWKVLANNERKGESDCNQCCDYNKYDLGGMIRL